MAALKFNQNDEGEDLKEAIGMYSKEQEYVNFDKICDCKGQVKMVCHMSFCTYIVHIQRSVSATSGRGLAKQSYGSDAINRETRTVRICCCLRRESQRSMAL